MPEAKRTLVKSGPELWAEVSDPGALARHLAPFGDIRITRTEPETLVAWEADRAAGEVSLAESGFGTKVVITARIATIEVEPQPAAVEARSQAAAPEPEPEREPEPEPEPVVDAARPGFWARLFRRRAPEAEPVTEPVAAEPELPAVDDPQPEPEAESEIVVRRTEPAMADDAALLILTDTLDALGRAHHRPFSRA
jgi:hypothetical protein